MWNVSAFLTQTFAFVLGRAFSIINNASGSLVCSLRGGLGNSVSPPGHKSRRKSCQQKGTRDYNMPSLAQSVSSYSIFWYACVLAGAALSANDKYVCEIFGKEDLCLI